MLVSRFIEDGALECGLDEAGRGCLAGPVYAAAVILPKDFYHPLLHDSKQLTQRQRDLLHPIIEREAVAWALGVCTVQEIDELNILRASHLAMHRAVQGLAVRPERLLVDGNRFTPYSDIPHECIVKGDGKISTIAAASILAKTHRDEAMLRLDLEYPMYGWARHKGYPTRSHRAAIQEFGPSPHHRLTFKL